MPKTISYLLVGTAIVLMLVFGSFITLNKSYATSGTCSDHGGVNCSAGADWDGSAICNDSWRDSTEIYSQQQICSSTHYGCSNLEEIYAKYNLPAKLDAMTSFFHESNSLFNSCVASANAIANINERALRSLQCVSENSARQAQDNAMSSEYDSLKRIADAECEQSGFQELEQNKIKWGYYSPQQNTAQYTCPANSTQTADNFCSCNSGYSNYRNQQCVTNDDYCKLTFGINSFAKFIDNTYHCTCDVGYWDQSGTSCVKPKTQITQPPPKPINQPIKTISLPEKPSQKVAPLVKTSETKSVQNESLSKESKDVQTEITSNETVTIHPTKVFEVKNGTQTEQNFFSRFLGSVMSIFSRIFK